MRKGTQSTTLAGLALALMLVCLSGVTCGGVWPWTPVLEGTWSGALACAARFATSDTAPPELDETVAPDTLNNADVSVTFAADGTPDKLPVFISPYRLTSSEMVELTSVQPGDSQEFGLDELGGTRTMTVTVREATYSPVRMDVVLDVMIAWDGVWVSNSSTTTYSGGGSGVQTITAVPATDGSGLIWSQAVESASEQNSTSVLRSTGETVSWHAWTAQQMDAAGVLIK